MPAEIRVPQMGESVTEATILRWLKKEGDSVAAGEGIAELETDKVNVEVPADSAGVIQSFAHAEGDTVAVGDVLAVVGDAACRVRPSPVVAAPAAAPPLAAACPGDATGRTARRPPPRRRWLRRWPKKQSWTWRRSKAPAPAGASQKTMSPAT